LVLALVAAGQLLLPGAGAAALLHPVRRPLRARMPGACEAVQFDGVGVTLAAWRCQTTQPRRGGIVYLHGVADNRGSSRYLVDRFGPLGFDVVAYDSRSNGESTGDACTYGYYEKQDLRRVIDTLPPGPIVLVGGSLGAAVALQEAANDPRVTTVVAAETFSDLRTIAAERAPFFFTPGIIRRGLALAERAAAFKVDDVSPVKAASTLAIPVLLIHGDADRATRPEHSKRVAAALKGPKRLILVPGADHNESLRPEVWTEIERWIDQYVGEPEYGPRRRAV
jgi:pimeloyl-ACP methyl ester carboxylesterase